jgi:Na+-transporting methylmalonyl-CoA/oxaloacetate decarboxylase beta subunit
MTIIHTFEVLYFLPIGLPIAIAGIILTIVSALTLYRNQNSYTYIKSVGIIVGIFAFFIFFLACGLTETRHQILIDDNTSVVEVQQKYEIIGQKGISYIVKDIDT